MSNSRNTHLCAQHCPSARSGPYPSLQALLLSHKRKDVRDTSRYPPLMREQPRTGKLKPRALRHLAAEQLGLTIQEGEHSPVDDAVRCCGLGPGWLLWAMP